MRTYTSQKLKKEAIGDIILEIMFTVASHVDASCASISIYSLLPRINNSRCAATSLLLSYV